MEIKTIKFTQQELNNLKKLAGGQNWPVVYLIHNDKTMYIGETLNVSKRMQAHIDSGKRNELNTFEIIFDDEANKSMTLDYEQKLIRCFKFENKFKLQNIVDGQSKQHDYFNRVYYKTKFNELWKKLIKKHLAHLPLIKIENSDLYKYSPYSSLTSEQMVVSNQTLIDMISKLNSNSKGITIINGCAGTGKTILAIHMINTLLNSPNFEFDLSEDYDGEQRVLEEFVKKLKNYEANNHKLKIGFVFPMSGIRSTISNVFKELKNNFKCSMVLNPYNVVGKKYDIIFVDEAHRLKKYSNIGQEWKSFVTACKKSGLIPEESNQLDIILKNSKYAVLFFDKEQTIRSNDISFDEFKKSIDSSEFDVKQQILTSQMRCEGGSLFIDYVKSILDCSANNFKKINLYDFKLFDDVDLMVNKIKQLNKQYNLCRNVAGYSWEWKTKNKGSFKKLKQLGLYDININGNKYIWNMSTKNWIHSKHSIDTIGCIHTTQGFDLNYVGVIFGEEIDYDPSANKIIIDTNKFYDDKSIQGIKEPEEIKKFILNAYKTMIVRGIKGCYIYACNKNLRNYFSKFIDLFLENKN